jgi:4-hydroxy-4-methyl-2-oxoglutarate aldolase
MYVVNDLPPQIDRELLDRLVEADPATIGHFLHIGFMDPAIRGLMPNTRIAGTAVPVRAPGPDSTILHYALGQVREGDVLVIDRCGDHKHAGTGGVVAYAARKAGVKGIIVDGVVADLHELRAYGVPIWARGSSGITTKRGMGCGGWFCVPASCGGVVVEPGDAILADESGILVLRPDQIEAAADRALQLQAAEKEILRRLDAGEKLPDISGATKRVLEGLGA